MGIINRDLKQSNICFGQFSRNNNKFIKSLNIIDFDLAKRFTSKNFVNAKAKNMVNLLVVIFLQVHLL